MSACIHRLLYRSELCIKGTPGEVDEVIDNIVADAQTRNHKVDITGALVVVDGKFIQVLEGDLKTIRGVFERICRDMRHTHVELVDLTQASARAFSDWGMVRINMDSEADLLGEATADGIGIKKGMQTLEIVRRMRETLRQGGALSLA